MLERCGEAFVEVRLEAFAGTDRSDVWDDIFALGENGSSWWDAMVVNESSED